MARHVEAKPKEVARVIIDNWANVSRFQITKAAREVWLADNGNEADLIAALAYCKDIELCTTLPDFVALWERVQVDKGADFGGLIFGEGSSRNYGKVKAFAESLFAEPILRFLEESYSRLVTAAGGAPTPDARIQAYFAADEALGTEFRYVEDIDAVGKAMDKKSKLIDKLVEAEEKAISAEKKRLREAAKRERKKQGKVAGNPPEGPPKASF